MVSHTADKGGAERSLIEIAEALKNRQVTCFVLLPWKGPLENELQRVGINYAVVPYRWWVDSRPWWGRLPKYAKTMVSLPLIMWKLKSWKVNLVMTNTITTPVGAVAAFLDGKPHVWHIHEFGKQDHGLSYDFGARISSKLMDMFSDAIIAVSNAVARHHSQYVDQKKFTVVYPGPHAHARCGINQSIFFSDMPKLVLVGAITSGKGQLDAITALQILLNYGVKVQLGLVGAGDPAYLARLQETVKGFHLEGLVHFAGYVDDPTEMMQEADAVLVCSRSEAFAAAPIEAMTLGKPLIGADSGGTPELIQDGFNGLLYKSGDIADLASKIKLLIENPDMARGMGENGRKLAAERFTVEKYTIGVLQVFGEVLARKSTS